MHPLALHPFCAVAGELEVLQSWEKGGHGKGGGRVREELSSFLEINWNSTLSTLWDVSNGGRGFGELLVFSPQVLEDGW